MLSIQQLLLIFSFSVLISCSSNSVSQKGKDYVQNEDFNTIVNDTLKNENDSILRKPKISLTDITKSLCPQPEYNSLQEQADSLISFQKKAEEAKGSKEQIYWESKFFCSFPNSFSKMDSLFGHHSVAGPLYFSEIPPDGSVLGSMNSMINFFIKLESIPYKQYYYKYVKIGINGHWEADNIRTAFGFAIHLLNHPNKTCEVLTLFKDEQIKSIFRFIFDNAHPNHSRNKSLYNKLLQVLTNRDSKLSNLLTQSYDQLMSEDHSH